MPSHGQPEDAQAKVGHWIPPWNTSYSHTHKCTPALRRKRSRETSNGQNGHFTNTLFGLQQKEMSRATQVMSEVNQYRWLCSSAYLLVDLLANRSRTNCVPKAARSFQCCWKVNNIQTSTQYQSLISYSTQLHKVVKAGYILRTQHLQSYAQGLFSKNTVFVQVVFQNINCKNQAVRRQFLLVLHHMPG